MQLKTCYLPFVFLLLLTSCSKLIGEDDELTLAKRNYAGQQLLLNGYYFTEEENFEGRIFTRYSFYRNGVVRYLGSPSSLEETNFSLGKTKTAWGLFQIDSTNIKFERWYPSSGGALKAYVRKGIILNDTTFLITESYRNQNNEKTEVSEENELYHFRQFSPKPDSTNSFID